MPTMEDQQAPSSPQLKTYKLTASSVSYTKSTSSSVFSPTSLFKTCTSNLPRYILKDISLNAYPSQILAIVGPSGAGKSTLLDILSARTSPTRGTILLNSSPLNPSSFRKISSYVPQHDACLPLLTISETFAFSARLLMPNIPQSEPIVTSLLAQLGLTHLAHTRLGHGLSGGERRRVSIGLSLLHNPNVLILDEPTSGLDSSSAFNVMKILKSIAMSRSRTIILSIHQPSFNILTTIDKILFLSKGSVVHHGTLASLETFLLSKGFTIPPQLNALEYTMEVHKQIHVHNSSDSSISSPNSDHQNHDNRKSKPMIVKYKSRRAHEIITLHKRFWKIIYRTKQLLLTNTLEALIVGLVLGTIYINIGYDKESIEKRLGLFAFTLTFLLSSTTEALPIFIDERPIILRETSSGVYRLSSFIIANTLVFMPYFFVIATIYSFSLYFLVGLCRTWEAFSYFLLVIWIIILMANSFVLFLSSLAPNYITGTSLVTVLLGGFFLFSGYFISKDGMPKYWLFMHFFSMYKYGLDALLINEYSSCLMERCLIWYEDDKNTCMMNGHDVLEKRGLHVRDKWSNAYILIGFFLFYRLLCFIVLLRRISISKK